MESVIKNLPGIEPVVEAYTDALLSRRPHFRYVVGMDAKVMNVIKLLPQRVIDFLIQGPLNMMPLPLPAALQSASATSSGIGGGEIINNLKQCCRILGNQTSRKCSTGVLGNSVEL